MLKIMRASHPTVTVVLQHHPCMVLGWRQDLDYDAEDWLAENKMVHPETGKQLKSQKDLGLYLKEHWNNKAKESCWTCHR